ncbi:MAG: MFS transporter [Candidatus Sulfotelmatobacter sp.]
MTRMMVGVMATEWKGSEKRESRHPLLLKEVFPSTLTILMEPEPEHAVSSISLASYARLIHGNRNFRRLWLAQIVSEIGDWLYTLSIYTLLLQLTGSAGSVALALVLQVLPQTFVGPTAGVVNDRLKRKHVMIAADLIRFAVVLSMLFVRSRSLVWLIYPLLVAETSMTAFFEPARSAVIPNIADPGDVLAANTLSSATWSVNLMIGAALGGVVAAFFGRDAAFILNAISFLASAALITGMRFEETHAGLAEPLRPRDLVDFSPIVEGFAYMRSHPTLLPAVFAKAGELMIGPSWVIFTVMGAREFAVHGHGVDAAGGAMLGMSILLGGRGIGALVGPLISARWAGHDDHRLRLGILFGYLTIAVGYSVLGASRSVWMAAACAMVAHAGGSTVWVFSTTLLQLNTEDRFRGRVFAADLGLGSLSFAVTAYLAGCVLDAGVSVRVVSTTTGLFMLVPAVLLAIALRSKRFRAYASP